MYSYQEYSEENDLLVNKGIDAEALLTRILNEELSSSSISEDPAEIERVKYGRKFKTGDWVCFNHGEYPEHICREPWQITHWSFEYNRTTGSPRGRIHKLGGSSHEEKLLRYAHPDEIDYYLSGLPWFFNTETREYEKIEIFNKGHFKIGTILDTREFISYDGAQIMTTIIELNEMLAYNKIDKNDLFNKIFEKLK